MTRKECLEQAMGCVLRDRQKQYGEPEDCFETIAMMWSAYLGKIIQGWDVATMMALLKIARIKANPAHADNWCDLAGYAACGAECRQKFEAEMKKTVEDAFETFPHLKPEADGDCRQNGNDQPEEPKFKPGDAVEWNSVGSGWLPAVYEREFGDFGHCVVQMDGSERIVSKVDLRRPEANCPENPDSSPEFKRGDKVEVQMTPDSSTWASAVITAVYRDKDSCEWRYCVDFEDGWAHVTVPSARVRPVSGIKAEGCEELVEKDAPLCGERCEEFIPGLGTCEGCHHAREKDAPQTKEELFNRIVDCNPSTFGCVHKPTGEELAEMAEEEPHG